MTKFWLQQDFIATCLEVTKTLQPAILHRKWLQKAFTSPILRHHNKESDYADLCNISTKRLENE